MKSTHHQIFARDLSKNLLTDIEVIDHKAIAQGIENVLLTNYKERLFNPEFGSVLTASLFEVIDESNAGIIFSSIVASLHKFDKRIEIVESDCAMDVHKDEGYLILDIVYRVKNQIEKFSWRKKISI